MRQLHVDLQSSLPRQGLVAEVTAGGQFGRVNLVRVDLQVGDVLQAEHTVAGSFALQSTNNRSDRWYIGRPPS